MNLIYVALTRAKSKLIILHDEANVQKKHICSLMVCIPRDLYSFKGDIEKHFEVINSKLQKRRSLFDEDSAFVRNHTVNEQQDLLLATKVITPELFATT